MLTSAPTNRCGIGTWTTNAAHTPQATIMTGVLAGKKIIKIFSGGQHILALDTNGTLYGWIHDF